MTRLLRLLKAGALFLVVVYLMIGAVVYFQQDRMVFVPSRFSSQEMDVFAEAKGFEPWVNGRGERIGWQSKDGNPDEVLLIFSGNGGTSLGSAGFHYYCQQHPGHWKTFLLEYPGYGSREGTPSESSLTAAGVEAVDVLADQPGRRIWLLGFSLGSGTASATVRQRPDKVDGVLLMVPFNSITDTASHHYPYFPVSWFMKTRFDSEENLRSYRGPVAFILSAKDSTIPVELGKKLYEGYPGIKRMWIEPEADHDVSPLLAKHWGEIVGWMQSVAEQKGMSIP
jgi:uncharacterized protein